MTITIIIIIIIIIIIVITIIIIIINIVSISIIIIAFTATSVTDVFVISNSIRSSTIWCNHSSLIFVECVQESEWSVSRSYWTSPCQWWTWTPCSPAPPTSPSSRTTARSLSRKAPIQAWTLIPLTKYLMSKPTYHDTSILFYEDILLTS